MQQASDITLQVFVVSTMLALGLRIPLNEVTRGLRNVRSLIPGAALNLLVIPALGVLVANAFDLPPALRVGFVLIAISPGAPFALKLIEFAHGEMAFSVALVIILQLAGLVSVPILADLFLSSTVELDYPQVIGSVLLLQLVPLVVGFSLTRIKKRSGSLSWARAVSILSDASFALLVVLVVIDDLPEVARILEPSVVAAVLAMLATSFAAGLALGGPATSGRRSLAIVSAGRKGGLALILAAASFDREPVVVIMIVAYSLIELVVLTGVAQWWRRRPPMLKVAQHQEVA
jgi:BASS family bile acid:Na+ symporter